MAKLKDELVFVPLDLPRPGCGRYLVRLHTIEAGFISQWHDWISYPGDGVAAQLPVVAHSALKSNSTIGPAVVGLLNGQGNPAGIIDTMDADLNERPWALVRAHDAKWLDKVVTSRPRRSFELAVDKVPLVYFTSATFLLCAQTLHDLVHRMQNQGDKINLDVLPVNSIGRTFTNLTAGEVGHYARIFGGPLKLRAGDRLELLGGLHSQVAITCGNHANILAGNNADIVAEASASIRVGDWSKVKVGGWSNVTCGRLSTVVIDGPYDGCVCVVGNESTVTTPGGRGFRLNMGGNGCDIAGGPHSFYYAGPGSKFTCHSTGESAVVGKKSIKPYRWYCISARTGKFVQHVGDIPVERPLISLI